MEAAPGVSGPALLTAMGDGVTSAPDVVPSKSNAKNCLTGLVWAGQIAAGLDMAQDAKKASV